MRTITFMKPLGAVPVIPVEVHSLPNLTPASFDWCATFGALLAVLVAYLIYRLKQRRTDDDYSEQLAEQRSLQALIRSLQEGSGRPATSQATNTRDKQSGEFESEHPFYSRRDGRQRYEVHPIQVHTDHPDGSALAAWARKLRAEESGK